MRFAKLVVLSALLVGCEQLYSKDTVIMAGPEFCGIRWQVIEILSRLKKETLVANSGIKLDRVQLELASSENGKTISVIATWPEGFSCVVASGGYVIRKSVRMAQ